MKIDILTLFPNMFKGPLDESIVKKAQEKSLVEIKVHSLRSWAKDKHQTTDDRPYGGGKGMILMIKPIHAALQDLKTSASHTILLSPQGQVFNQKKAIELSQKKHLILLAGHYEGFDERIREHLINEELSIGNYVLTGGELPAMIITDAIIRLLPGVLDPQATHQESFTNNTLDFPQYTRPEEFNGWKVPEVLLSGNHAEIAAWRNKQALKKTKLLRPDLLSKKQ